MSLNSFPFWVEVVFYYCIEALLVLTVRFSNRCLTLLCWCFISALGPCAHCFTLLVAFVFYAFEVICERRVHVFVW